MNVRLQIAPEILVIGDVLVDLVVDVPEPARPGSKVLGSVAGRDIGGVGCNVAIALARLGRDVRLVARVGDDDAAQRARTLLRVEQVDTSALMIEPGRATGTCLIQRGADGERAVTITDGSLLFPRPEQLEPSSMVGVAWVHIAPFDPAGAEAAAASARAAGCHVSVDLEPTSLPDRTQLHRLLRHVDVCILNEHAIAVLGSSGSRSVAADLLSMGPDVVIQTLGSAGVLVSAATTERHLPAPPTRVIDTTGAGDVFAAALIDRLLDDRQGVDAAVQWALRAAAFACGRAGSWQAAPSTDDLTDP